MRFSSAQVVRRVRIGNATVVYTDDGCYTSYPDGTGYGAHSHETPHYHVIAHRCGYGDDLLAYCREHEVCHHVAAEWIAGHRSQVLWPLCHGYDPEPAEALFEEMAAQQIQRWVRANERPIIGDFDWDWLKQRVLGVLDGAP